MLAVSDLALIILAAPDESFAHDGMSPQRIIESSRTGSLGFWRMTGIGWVGAMFQRALQSSSPRYAIEVFLNDLLSPRQSIASAHGEIMADQSGALLAPPSPNSTNLDFHFLR